ncbi:DUF3304 domain-containing protein [Collimonas arenae]|uniref:DUF3304 domain-containing protein n=1 Tax=Collimonas arenae TaxID=279058 RepID=UPI00057099A0|nr:DUF3304 domain-containing protein [Collimonas arenae]
MNNVTDSNVDTDVSNMRRFATNKKRLSWSNQIGSVTRSLLMLSTLGIAGLLAGCSEEKIPVEITGYDHIPDWSISGFSINGGSGRNLDPGTGGPGGSCCIEIPKHWRPGLKAKVIWGYDTKQTDPRTPPPSQEAEVDIPEYTPENLGAAQVHFYPNHRIKVVISKYYLGSPKYPMSPEDMLPWTVDQSLIEYYKKREGGK